MQRRRPGPVAALALAVALTAACGGESAAEPEPLVPSGTYTLMALDDAALPALLVQSGPVATFVAGGQFVVGADGVARLARDLSTVVGSLPPPVLPTPTPGIPVPGDLVREGAAVAWRPWSAPGLPPSLVVEQTGGTLRIRIDGRIHRFERR